MSLPGKLYQDPEVLDSLLAPFGMDAVPGQFSRADDVQPVEFARDPQARLIGMGDLCMDQ